MLRKLLIHEWRSFWKVPAFMCAFTLIYALVGGLTFQTDLWNTDNTFVQIVLVFGSIGCVFALIAPAIVLLIYTALRFYHNLYTDEGYLMHTLPVKKWQLITSKGLVAVIWYFITSIVICVAVFMMVALIVTSSRYGGVSWADLKEGFLMFSEEFFPILKEVIEMPLWLFVLLLLGYAVFSSCYAVLLLYAAVSIGHLWKKHPLAGTVLSYIAFYFVASMLTSIVGTRQLLNTFGTNSVMFSIEANDPTGFAFVGSYMRFVIAGSYLVSAIGILVFYSITDWIMSRKLNLD